MTRWPSGRRRRFRAPGPFLAVLAVLAVPVLVALIAAPAGAATPKVVAPGVGGPRVVEPRVGAPKLGGPDLTIGVDDGRPAAEAGDRLTYTVKVTNLGSTAVRGLRLTETVPAGARFLSATGSGTFAAGRVGWTVDLAAGATVPVRVKVALATVPAGTARLATVACAIVGSAPEPLVCAADLDRLPPGVREFGQPGGAGGTGRAGPAGGLARVIGSGWWWLGGVAGAVAVGAAALTVTRRFRRPRQAT